MSRKLQIVLCLGVFPVGLSLLGGCGKKADESKPISEVQSEAQKMDESALRKAAESYKDAIAAKRKDVEAMASKIKEIPITEALGDKVKELKTELDKLTASITALTERANVYVQELKKKNVDVSGLQP